jgi:hypothetical protein
VENPGMSNYSYERRLHFALVELADAAIVLDDVWIELGSCETADSRVEIHFKRFQEALAEVRRIRDSQESR